MFLFVPVEPHVKTKRERRRRRSSIVVVVHETNVNPHGNCQKLLELNWLGAGGAAAALSS